MRMTLKAGLAALASAALLAGITAPAAAGPHGGDGGGAPHGGGPSGNGGAAVFHGGGPGAFGGAAVSHGGGPSFAAGGPSFGGPRGGMGFSGSRGARALSMTFAAPRGSHGSSMTFAAPRGGPSPRGSHAFATASGQRFTGPMRGLNGGRAALAQNAFQGARGANRVSGPLGSNGFAGSIAGAPSGVRDFTFNEGFRGEAWRGDFDFDDFDWDDWLWPIGLGLAFDWTVGYPACPYWDYWYGWRCRWGYPAYYWGSPYGWGPYGWGPAYAWDAVYVPGPGYGYDWDDWSPPVYAAPVVTYAVWTPDYGYADYDGGCATRHWVWDPDDDAYVLRRDYDACWG